MSKPSHAQSQQWEHEVASAIPVELCLVCLAAFVFSPTLSLVKYNVQILGEDNRTDHCQI